MRKKALFLGASVLACSVLGGCSNKSNEKNNEVTTSPVVKQQEEGKADSFTAGTYTATAKGNGGDVTVTMELSETEIVSVKVDAASETAGLGDKAAETLSNQIVEKQSIGLDAVTGATVTSTAVLTAAEDCLKQAGADVEALKTPVAKENEGVVTELTTDVVVIGAGGAGMSAAVTSAEAGAEVILLEKTAIPGGTTANGGGFFAAHSKVSEEIGHEPVNVDYVFEKYMEEMDWMADAYLVRSFLNTSLTTADWLQEHGVEFHKQEVAVQQTHAEGTNGYHKYNDFTKTSATFASILENTKGLQIYYETPAYELITDDQGAVTGVLAKAKDGSTLKISAKSVIIATGGFVGNEEMVKEALNGVSVNAAGYNSNTGDGINMAKDLGAAFRSMTAMVAHTFNVDGKANIKGEYEPMDKMHASASIAYIPMNVWLNQQGSRIANEDMVYDRMLSGNIMMSTGNYAWFLYNESLLKTLEEKGAAAAGMYDKISMGPFVEYTPMNHGWTNLTAIMEEMVDGVNVVKADSFEELAKLSGMDEATLKATMERYNADAKAGTDSMYGKRAEHMYDMTEGPYYLVKVTTNNLCTVGGLRINHNMNVVKNDPENGYTAIKNLYAAGADAAGIYSDHYAHTIEGAAQGWAYNSGRLAGASAVKNAIDVDVKLD
ncbi:MAG: FAD-dependent oxidoreductase [Clostridiales bacterium]|nr:FAD-dependent oxidoreductase [Clostridiales bacterium]